MGSKRTGRVHGHLVERAPIAVEPRTVVLDRTETDPGLKGRYLGWWRQTGDPRDRAPWCVPPVHPRTGEKIKGRYPDQANMSAGPRTINAAWCRAGGQRPAAPWPWRTCDGHAVPGIPRQLFRRGAGPRVIAPALRLASAGHFMDPRCRAVARPAVRPDPMPSRDSELQWPIYPHRSLPADVT